MSVNSNGVQADRNSSMPQIDDNGQFVAFISDSAKLGGTFALCAYVRNTKTGVTEPILPTDNFDLDLSGSSRCVALVVSGNLDVYDRFAHTVDTIAGPASKATISANGQYAAFMRPRPSGSGGATDKASSRSTVGARTSDDLEALRLGRVDDLNRKVAMFDDESIGIES